MYEFEAIGTHWWLERLDSGDFADVIRHDLEAYTAQFGQRYSRFREDSLVSELSKNGSVKNMPDEMRRMLDFAETMKQETGGAFDIYVGDNLKKLGYGTDNASTVDFGGFGKGWLIDEYAKLLRSHGVKYFIVNGGGDLYVDAPEPVVFALEHPYDPKLKVGDIRIQKGALAASSTLKRSWNNGDEAYHHIIDPSTGMPSGSSIVASFVLADTALVADTLATVLIVEPKLEENLKERFSIQPILIRK